jgi:S-formylglutathione hydrolase FrmB
MYIYQYELFVLINVEDFRHGPNTKKTPGLKQNAISGYFMSSTYI